jgi:hypothetical protein
MLPEERRWKWVKKENLPEDFVELMEKLSSKKGKGEKKERVVSLVTEKKDEGDDEEQNEYITEVKTRNDLLIDYSIILNVKERLEILTQERFKGKFSMDFHVLVLTRMAE